jgi:hypothetical protein
MLRGEFTIIFLNYIKYKMPKSLAYTPISMLQMYTFPTYAVLVVVTSKRIHQPSSRAPSWAQVDWLHRVRRYAYTYTRYMPVRCYEFNMYW